MSQVWKKGTFCQAKLCQSINTQSPTMPSAAIFTPSTTTDTFTPTLAMLNMTASGSVFKVSSEITINETVANALIDTGSSDRSFISPNLVKKLCLHVVPEVCIVGMATKSVTKQIKGFCIVDFKLLDRVYKNIKLFVLENLCTDIILGTDFQQQHESIVINYGGEKPTLTFCAVTAINTKPA